MVRGLVPVPVAALREELVEPSHERLAPSHGPDQGRDVVGDEEGVVPGRALGDPGLLRRGVEGPDPPAVRVPPAHEADRGVEDVPPVRRALRERGGHVLAAEGAGERADREVVVRVLEGARDLLSPVERLLHLLLERDVAERERLREGPAALAVHVLLVWRGLGRVLDEGPERRLAVEAAHALHPRVGDHGRAVVADHRARVAVPAGEVRQEAALVGLGEERADEMRHPLGLEKDQQRVLRAEGVPEREVVVVVEADRTLDRPAAPEARVGTVRVAEEPRLQEGVVERGVEDQPLVARAAPHAHPPEGFVPGRLGAGPDLVEAGRCRSRPPGSGRPPRAT